MKKMFIINVGSTSTKVAYYEDDKCILKENITHPLEETKAFDDVMDQREYRTKIILDFMKTHDLNVEDMDAIVSRGGHTKPVVSGAYKINEIMLTQQASGKYGRHPVDVGTGIAFDMCKGCKAVPMTVDPPVSDEFSPVAHLSGHPLMPREVRFHVLSHKATAKRYAKDIGKDYNDLNLISIHMGGGITTGAHCKGKIIDGNNGIEGEGPYSTNRTGGLMAKYVVDLCFSGKYTQKEISKMINGEGGLVAYLGESDVLTVQKMAETDPYAKLVLEGMFYQACKEVGALSTVLCGDIDAILITGGIAYGESIVEYMKSRLSWIAPIAVYPGENEMQSLAEGSLEALTNPELMFEMEE